MRKGWAKLLLLSFPILVNAQSFTEISQFAGVNHQHYHHSLMGGGAGFFDCNNDGFEDLYLTGADGPDHFFNNNGDGNFLDITSTAGFDVVANIKTAGAFPGDFDNDGDEDLFLTTNSLTHNLLFENMGNGVFEDISFQANVADTSHSATATFGDYNQDGYLDLYVGNHVSLELFPWEPNPDFFYLNNGDGTFTDIYSMFNLGDTVTSTLALAFTDYDFDSDLDLMVISDFGMEFHGNLLFRNEFPLDSFTNVSNQTGWYLEHNSMGVAKGDYDEDGDFDYYITDIGANELMNYENGSFTNTAIYAGVADSVAFIGQPGPPFGTQTVGWGTAFFDYNNNTYLDLYLCNGALVFGLTVDKNRFFKNNDADGTFTDISDSAGVGYLGNSKGMAVADYDNDGDLDMLVNANS